MGCSSVHKPKRSGTDNNSNVTSTLNEKQFNEKSSRQNFKGNDDIISQPQPNQKFSRVKTLTSVPYIDRVKLIKDLKVLGAKYPRGEKIFNIKMDSGNNGKGDESENLIQEVELFLSMKDIQKISNYSIKVWICNNKKLKQYDYLGQTEEISEANIDFGTTFSFNYYFEKEQILRLNIIEDNNKLIEKDITVGTIMGSVNAILSKKIEVDDVCCGNIQLELKKKEKNLLENQISKFTLKFELNDINSGEYFILLKRKTNSNKNWRTCYKSNEFFLQNGTLPQFTIDTILLCDSEKDFLLLELYDSNDTIFKGCTQFSLENVNKNSRIKLYDAINSPTQIGYVTINHTHSLKKTFIDYIKGGININLDIAIDYTASNEDPSNPNSLHYFLGNQPNDYEKAIYSCGNIVGFYDRDQVFPVYGFGGIPKGQNKVSHCFNINFEESKDKIKYLIVLI